MYYINRARIGLWAGRCQSSYLRNQAFAHDYSRSVSFKFNPGLPIEFVRPFPGCDHVTIFSLTLIGFLRLCCGFKSSMGMLPFFALLCLVAMQLSPHASRERTLSETLFHAVSDASPPRSDRKSIKLGVSPPSLRKHTKRVLVGIKT